MDSKSIIWALLLIAAVIHLDTCFAFTKALERSKLDGHDSHDIELYIEQKIHYIHSKIDLRPTIAALLTLNKCITQLSKGVADSLNSSLRNHLEYKLNRMVKKLKRVSSKIPITDRTKRSIEFIGNLISDIFGNPGPADWKKANANFLALQNALKKLNENTFTDHNTIDTNSHSIEKHNEDLKKLNLIINRNQNEIMNINDSLSGLKMYFDIVLLADTVESQIDSLVEIKVESNKGYCSDRALSKEFLIDNLQSLEANKAGLGPVFGSWEWREFYKHAMCTSALENDILWLTLRIPLVKKAEKLVRYIPSPDVREVLSKISNYGIQVTLFKEKNNEKYHVMTQSSFDLCNVMGNIRTCGVRDARFNIVRRTVIPVEFNVNKFLLVGANDTEINMMEKCLNGINEHKLVTDVVMMVPNNCSYVSGSVYISTREADVEVMEIVGIIQFEKLVINKVKSTHANMSKTSIETIAKHTSETVYEQNRKDIDELLNAIDTKHENFSSIYWKEKWIFAGGLIGLLAIFVCGAVMKRCRRRRNEGRVEFSRHNGNDKIQIVLEQPNTHKENESDENLKGRNELDDEREHVYQELPASISGSRANLGSRPERSQFFKK